MLIIHRTFIRIGRVLGHRKMVQRVNIMQTMFCDHNVIKLKTKNNKRVKNFHFLETDNEQTKIKIKGSPPPSLWVKGIVICQNS